jgi:hypothetical protein
VRARAAQLVRSEHGERVEQRGQRALAPDLADEVPALMIRVLAFTLAVIVPLLVAVGILLTFRTAGPLYRLETHLEAVIAGRETGPCRLRDGDELQAALRPRQRGARRRAPVGLERPAQERVAAHALLVRRHC